MTKSFSWKPEISGEANVANFYERQNTSDCCSPRQFQFLSEFPQLHKYALWSLCDWLLCFSFVHRFAFQPANPWSLHKILTKYLFLLQLLAKDFLPKCSPCPIWRKRVTYPVMRNSQMRSSQYHTQGEYLAGLTNYLNFNKWKTKNI